MEVFVQADKIIKFTRMFFFLLLMEMLMTTFFIERIVKDTNMMYISFTVKNP